jgi:hypothetical protein
VDASARHADNDPPALTERQFRAVAEEPAARWT